MRRGKTQNLKQQSRNISGLVPRLLEWFGATARDLPWRRTRDPYAIWVSEIMLQQTQVKTVIPYFERWMRELPTVESLAEAPSEKIHKLWEGLGYYTRVRNMQRAAKAIVAGQGGTFPSAFEDVLALPGIGRYTAGAICSIAFDAPTPILDGNVIRVLTRLFGIEENAREKDTNAKLWTLAQQLVSAASELPSANSKSKFGNSSTSTTSMRRCSALNQALMELGALVCTPRLPQCDACPIAALCRARREGTVDRLPNLGERGSVTPRRFAAVLLAQDGRALVRQRPPGVVNAHLWEFPNAEIPLRASARELKAALEMELGCAAERLVPVGDIRHTITRYRIKLEVFRAELNGARPSERCGVWKSAREMESLAFTSAHARIRKQWLE